MPFVSLVLHMRSRPLRTPVSWIVVSCKCHGQRKTYPNLERVVHTLGYSLNPYSDIFINLQRLRSDSSSYFQNDILYITSNAFIVRFASKKKNREIFVGTSKSLIVPFTYLYAGVPRLSLLYKISYFSVIIYNIGKQE